MKSLASPANRAMFFICSYSLVCLRADRAGWRGLALGASGHDRALTPPPSGVWVVGAAATWRRGDHPLALQMAHIALRSFRIRTTSRMPACRRKQVYPAAQGDIQ